MSSGTRAGHFAAPAAQRQAAEFGVWVFLATELMFFGPLFIGYLQGRMLHPEAFAAASKHTSMFAGTVNTFVLLTSSLFVALAAAAVRRNARRAAAVNLWVAASLGVVFLAIKAWEYVHEWREALVPGIRFNFEAAHAAGAEMFFWLYFAMTGIHAVHLLLGIGLLSLIAWRLRRRGARGMANLTEGVGLYWHFVDVLWVFLYPLLYLVERHS